MTDWLVHTLAWTAALIALVLVLRRPVARYCGPQAAYALWLLPMLRLVVPPIELPAWLAPKADPVDPALHTVMLPIELADAQAAAQFSPVASDPIDWAAVLLAVWLVGTAVFLVRRFTLYFRMRDELLADATPVGCAGGVRLVETPAASSPVAFGVLDRVIALPPGFMAWHDRTSRDLALAHELAHHRGRDLLVNFAAQPLFAMHWFNPLGWYGWSALRRDQEAACDARVVASCARQLRGTYASVIAGFAAGPNVALAAPMACPVLGQKSIIHRLRSLAMTDISPRRRMAGRALLAIGVLALPLTASITYAERLRAQEPPAAPLPPEATGAPLPPEAAPAPHAPVVVREVRIERDGEGQPVRKVMVVRREREAAEDARTSDVERRIERETRVEMHDLKGLAEAEVARIQEEVRNGLKDANLARVEARVAELEALRLARIDMPKIKIPRTRVVTTCERGASAHAGVDGTALAVACAASAHRMSLAGIRQARETLAREKSLSAEVRAEIVSALDAELARLEKGD